MEVTWEAGMSTSSLADRNTHRKERGEEGRAETSHTTSVCWCRATLTSLGWEEVQEGGWRMVSRWGGEALLPKVLEALHLYSPCSSLLLVVSLSLILSFFKHLPTLLHSDLRKTWMSS